MSFFFISLDYDKIMMEANTMEEITDTLEIIEELDHIIEELEDEEVTLDLDGDSENDDDKE